MGAGDARWGVGRASRRAQRARDLVEHAAPARSLAPLRTEARGTRAISRRSSGRRGRVPALLCGKRTRLRAHRARVLGGGLAMALKESTLEPSRAAFDQVVDSGAGFSKRIACGQVLRIVDLEGNQAVDTLFYHAHEPAERYSAVDTIREQANIYLTTGTRLFSTEGNVLLTIVADTCGRHDTLGGACAAESNQVRYAIDKKYMHSCRDTFLLEIQTRLDTLTKRDITHNINFFMNVPVT